MPFVLIVLYSLACGIAIFDAVLKDLPETHKLIVWVSQRGLAGVCAVVIFCVAYMLLSTIYILIREAIRKAVDKAKNGE